MKAQQLPAFEKEHRRELEKLDHMVVDKERRERAAIPIMASLMQNYVSPMTIADVAEMAVAAADELLARLDQAVN